MIVYKCDICKKEYSPGELGKISFADSGQEIWKHLSRFGLMQGTRMGDELLCPYCYQKFCWAFANLITGEITPQNPVKE